ncbi:MAG: response regulator transcription factor [Actinomycetota bacterium]|nr:response regulator transcription factor [Actinomycetota bacterium]
MSARILVVDDEPAIVDGVGYALRNEGFAVDTARNGEDALAAARADGYDLVILDLMLPRVSGLEVARALRGESPVPIIMLTAKDAEVDRVVGLELGADDYVTKPFSMAELLSRVRAILRRRELDRADGGPSVRQVGGLRLDLTRHQVTVGEKTVQLTPLEFKLVALLAEEPERVFSRTEIMRELWESPHVGDQRACDFHISNVRRKIERDPARPERLLTVRAVGYILVPV